MVVCCRTKNVQLELLFLGEAKNFLNDPRIYGPPNSFRKQRNNFKK